MKQYQSLMALSLLACIAANTAESGVFVVLFSLMAAGYGFAAALAALKK